MGVREVLFLLSFVITHITCFYPKTKGGLDDPCGFDTECKIEFSFCYNREKCRCRPNYTYNQKTKHCVLSCTSDKGCQTTGNFACPNPQCACDHYFIKKHANCIKRDKVHVGERCEQDEDCLGQSVCVEDTCQCDKGFRHVGNDICQPASLGDPCHFSDDCTSLNGTVHCNNGTCQCKENHFVQSIVKNDTCLKAAAHDDSCEEHVQCVFQNSECLHSRCACKKGFRLHSDECIRSAEIGETCNTALECNPLSGGSHCHGGVCACKSPDFIRSRKKHDSCLRVSHFSTFCEEEGQCPGNSTCFKARCQCRTGHRWSGKECISTSQGHLSRQCSWIVFVSVFLLYR